MINKVYLLWNTYETNELLTIGSLTKLDKGYIFKYGNDAKKAMSLGCFLPFNYTEENIYFDSLPYFFTQRMLKSKFNVETFGVDFQNKNELDILTYGDAIKNNDNFRVISEQSFNTLKKESNDYIVKNKAL